MDLFGIIFRNFNDQQNCMIIGFNLIYNFNSSRLKPNLSRCKKSLHVFWNTLYKYMSGVCRSQRITAENHGIYAPYAHITMPSVQMKLQTMHLHSYQIKL